MKTPVAFSLVCLFLSILACDSKKELVKQPVDPSTVQTETSDESGIVFTDVTYMQALERAEEEGKYVFMDGYAVWCGPCKSLDKYTFSDKAVGAYFNENFINIKVDMEKGEGLTLRQKFGITGYPTMLIIGPEDKIVGRLVGWRSAEDLLNFGKEHTR